VIIAAWSRWRDPADRARRRACSIGRSTVALCQLDE
jgi:hypothetical protein